MIPNNFFFHDPPSEGKRRILEFNTGELLIEHGVVYRIEFTEKRCNLTLKNSTAKRQSVHVRLWVLNKSLIEIWRQTEKWSLTALQPDQSHLVSWEFKPEVPDVIWNQKARDAVPTWLVIDAL